MECLTERPFYENNEGPVRVRAYAHPEVRGAYDIVLGEKDEGFFVPDRILDDLASPRSTLEHFVRGMTALNSFIPTILSDKGLTFESLYAHALKIRMKEIEAERDFAIHRRNFPVAA